MDNAVEKRVMTHQDKVDYILSKSFEYFGITPTKGQSVFAGRTPNWNKKRYIAKVLLDNTVLTQQEIADALGYSQHSSIIYHAKTLANELSPDVYGEEKTKRIYSDYISYLNL